MATFIVFTVDHDQQQAFVDITNAESGDTALGTVLKYRDYSTQAPTPDHIGQHSKGEKR